MNEANHDRPRGQAAVQRRGLMLLGVAGGAAVAAMLAALAGPPHDDGRDDSHERAWTHAAPSAPPATVPATSLDVDIDWRRVEAAPEHAAAAVAAYEH